MKSVAKTLAWVTMFSIAMAFLESAVVIYLRELYYPQGFKFPLEPVPAHIGRVEFLRELATVVMLVGCGILAGATKLQRFAYFALAFAVWDVFYYVFLYVCIGWPLSLNDWDILFLIPFPWVGPVWAPCLVSLLIAAGAVYVVIKTENNPSFRVRPFEWILSLSGATICIISFMWDYLIFTTGKGNLWMLYSNNNLFDEIKNYVPETFNLLLFCVGFVLMCLALVINFIHPQNKQTK